MPGHCQQHSMKEEHRFCKRKSMLPWGRLICSLAAARNYPTICPKSDHGIHQVIKSEELAIEAAKVKA